MSPDGHLPLVACRVSREFFSAYVFQMASPCDTTSMALPFIFFCTVAWWWLARGYKRKSNTLLRKRFQGAATSDPMFPITAPPDPIYGEATDVMTCRTRYFECDGTEMCFEHVHRPQRQECDHCGRLRTRLLQCSLCQSFSCIGCHWGSRTRCSGAIQVTRQLVSRHTLDTIADIVSSYIPLQCVYTEVEEDLRKCATPACSHQARDNNRKCLSCLPKDICYSEHIANPNSNRLFKRIWFGEENESLLHFSRALNLMRADHGLFDIPIKIDNLQVIRNLLIVTNTLASR